MNYEVYESKTALWSMVSIAVVLILTFGFILYQSITDPEGRSIATELFCAFIVVLLAWYVSKLLGRLRINSLLLVVGPDGIIYYQNGERIEFSKSEVEGICIYEFHNKLFLGIMVYDEEQQLDKLPRRLRRLPLVNRANGFPAFSIIIQFVKNKKGMIRAFEEYQYSLLEDEAQL